MDALESEYQPANASVGRLLEKLRNEFENANKPALKLVRMP